jgi:putative peptidoglycan lipid II flippase
MFNAMTLIFLGVITMGLLWTPSLVSLIAWGFRARPDQFLLTVGLTRILMPFLAFMSLAAIFMGSNNVFARFTPGAMASSFLNLSLILCWIGLRRWGSDLSPEQAVRWWAWGALFGGFLQMAVQVPSAWKGGFRPAWRGNPFGNPKVRSVFRSMIPALIANSTLQVNILINSVLASFLAAGSITYIYYGSRLFQLPLGIVGVSVSAAALPTLASLHARRDVEAFKRTLGHALRLTLFVTLPAAVGMILLAVPINVLLFRWGNFSEADAVMTAKVSVCYSLGVVFASWVKVLVPSLYAREEGGVAARISLVIIALDLILNLSLMGRLGALSFALTTSVCNLLQASALLWLLRRRVGPLIRQEVFADFGKLALAGIAMGLALQAGKMAWEQGLSADELYRRSRLALEVPVLMALSALVYFGTAHLLGLRTLSGLLGKPFKKT